MLWEEKLYIRPPNYTISCQTMPPFHVILSRYLVLVTSHWSEEHRCPNIWYQTMSLLLISDPGRLQASSSIFVVLLWLTDANCKREKVTIKYFLTFHKSNLQNTQLAVPQENLSREFQKVNIFILMRCNGPGWFLTHRMACIDRPTACFMKRLWEGTS